MNLRFIIILLLLNVGIANRVVATHNRAGEITFRQINNLTIEVTITTYTKASSVSADRDSLELFWGDNTSQYVRRDNSKTKLAANDVKINYYIAEHTYPGPATYTMYFLDPNRVSTILNINYPNSVDIPFFLSTTFTLLNQQFQGINNSVVLLQPPLDIACAGRKFTHNPNGYDPDGDSLVYELAIPLQAANLPVPGYQYPDEIAPGSNNKISINSKTGEFVWDAPVLQGEYNIAIRILEYRRGQLINTVLRDMQILVRACVNDPPEIQTIDEICVVAGEFIDLPILVTDPNNGQKIKLYATGGPFEVEDGATLSTPDVFTASPIQARFIWQTNCEHISKDYFQVVFRALDNYFGDSSGLATLKTVRIKVVGPPPEKLMANVENQAIRLHWNMPYDCDASKTMKFTGFAVYRSTMSFPFQRDTCQPGLAQTTYQKIAISVKTFDSDGYTFLDQNIQKGFNYCYRVVAEFSLFTSSGVPYSKIEGLASDEICIQTSREIPLLTKVSVLETDPTGGQIEVSWSKPLIMGDDTMQFPPPYTFQFYRSVDGINFTKLDSQTKTTDNLKQFFDTTFIDAGLNTTGIRYHYRIETFSGQNKLGDSQTASSVFTSIMSSDRSLTITWIETVPWSNFEYDIFQVENGNSIFIGNTSLKNYKIDQLENGKTYCFKIVSKGRYNLAGLNQVLINESQIACGVPVDNVPPCTTTIGVKNPCDLIQSGASINELFNVIEWENVIDVCPALSGDAAGYHVYYAVDQQSEYSLVGTIYDPEAESYTHYPQSGVAGCYYVTAFDTLENESVISNIFCLENCPLYDLPNTFTPNGDNNNDVFEPTVNFFIDRIHLKVYNQWGNFVFETTNPEIKWDGKNLQGKLLADGVYHYTCQVFVKQVDGSTLEQPPLTGFIQIIR